MPEAMPIVGFSSVEGWLKPTREYQADCLGNSVDALGGSAQTFAACHACAG